MMATLPEILNVNIILLSIEGILLSLLSVKFQTDRKNQLLKDYFNLSHISTINSSSRNVSLDLESDFLNLGTYGAVKLKISMYTSKKVDQYKSWLLCHYLQLNRIHT